MEHSLVGLDAIAVSWLMVLVQQTMKNSTWRMFSWISDETGGVNRLVSAILASLSAAGIHFSWQAEEGILTVTGITALAASHFLWDILKNYLGQKIIYKLAYAAPTQTT